METKSESAAQRAYAVTKEEILTGRIQAGALVSEGEVAERLAVSRTPVREAFLRLEAEDLLRLIPKRGAVVLPVPPNEAADILDVRLALETSAMIRLARPDSDLDPVLAQLADLIDRQAATAKMLDVPGFAEADQMFHRSIVDASGNAIARRFYASLGDRQRRMTIGAVGSRPARLHTLVTEHRRLMERVRDRDADGFRVLLATHLDTTHNVYYGR